MSTISQFMQQNHRHCDDLFTRAEASVADSEWGNAVAQWDNFSTDLIKHLAMEEQVLFPAFEQATGNTQGPTVVMRMEHEQMRMLLEEMADCIESQDQARFLGLSESLMLLIQQHNMKEEQMLYPMADRALPHASDILARMQAVD